MPSITFVASSIRFIFSTLLTNGNERLARRLHSITLMSFSRARYWILNGPEMFSSRAISRLMRLMRRTVSTYNFCGGNWIVASPECTPANSICSLMAYAIISPSCATASISTSLACSMNWLTTTGCFLLTFAASFRKRSSSSRLEQTFIAAPTIRRKDGPIPGKPTLSTKALMSSREVSARHSGWSTPMRSSMAENLSRSSALSMLLALVPRIGTFCASRRRARYSVSDHR